MWDVRTGKPASTTKLKKSAFLFLAWNPAKPSILAAVQQDSETFFIDVQKQSIFKTLPSRLQVHHTQLIAMPVLLILGFRGLFIFNLYLNDKRSKAVALYVVEVCYITGQSGEI